MSNDTPRVLIVDPQSDELARSLKGHEGRELDLLVAVDGEDGVDKAFKHAPDLVVLEAFLPVLDGLEVCRRLKANPRTADVPVIFIAASTTVEQRLSGFEAGAVDFIGKPFCEREVLARIFVHLRNKRQLDRLRGMLGEHALAGVGDRAFPDEQLFARALAMLDKRMANPPSQAEMAAALGSNERKLTEVFRERLGMTVFEYFSELRLEMARHLLEGSAMQIQAIATHVGYRNAGDFTRAYRRRFGLSPREHRDASMGGTRRASFRIVDRPD